MRARGTRPRGRTAAGNAELTCTQDFVRQSFPRPPPANALCGAGKEASESSRDVGARTDGGGRHGTHPHGRFCRTVCGVGKEAGESSCDACARADVGVLIGTEILSNMILLSIILG